VNFVGILVVYHDGGIFVVNIRNVKGKAIYIAIIFKVRSSELHIDSPKTKGVK
jgi:hypothetical protein